MKDLTLRLVRIALIAALYAAITVVWPLSYDVIQFRLSEALIALVIWRETEQDTVPGMTLGTLLGNILSPYGILDMILGTIATFVGAMAAWYLRKKHPVIPLTAYILGVTPIVAALLSMYGVNFFFAFGTVFIGEATVVYAIGLPLAFRFKKLNENA